MEDIDAAIHTGWEEVTAKWEDDEVHQRFIALCLGIGRLDAAGTRYRRVKESDPSRAAKAETYINKILVLAMQSMAMQQSPHATSGTRGVRWALYAFALLMLLGATWLLIRFR